MTKLLVLIFLFLSVTGIDLRAEEILIWEDCVLEARKNHPDLISAVEKLKQAKASKNIATSRLLPQISSNLNLSSSYSYGLSGSQLLFDGLKTIYDRSAAGENVQSAEYNYRVTSSNVRLRLRTAFIGLLRAEELLNLTEEIAARRKQNVDLVNLRYQVGREHRGSLLTAQANLAQAEFEVSQARRNIALARRSLIKELGRSEFSPILVKGDFQIKYSDKEMPDFENLAESNPLLLEIITRKESARFGLKSAQANFFPQVFANAATSKSDGQWPPEHSQQSVGVNVSFPLFSGGSRLADVSRTKALFNQLQADTQSERANVVLTLQQTWTNLQDAIENIAVQKKFLEAVIERSMITEAQYSIGLVSFDDWTIIEDNLVNVKKSFLNTQSTALIVEADWLQAKGETLNEK